MLPTRFMKLVQPWYPSPTPTEKARAVRKENRRPVPLVPRRGRSAPFRRAAASSPSRSVARLHCRCYNREARSPGDSGRQSAFCSPTLRSVALTCIPRTPRIPPALLFPSQRRGGTKNAQDRGFTFKEAMTQKLCASLPSTSPPPHLRLSHRTTPCCQGDGETWSSAGPGAGCKAWSSVFQEEVENAQGGSVRTVPAVTQ